MSSTTIMLLIPVALLVGISLGYLYSRMATTAGTDSLYAELNSKVSEARERENQSKSRADALDAKLAELNSELKTALEEKGRLQAEATRVEDARKEVDAKTKAELESAARISQLEADLKNERQNVAEKLAFLEEAKGALSNQFQALAADILDQKSKSFSEGSKKDIEILLNPFKTQIEEFKKKVEEAQSDSKTGVATLQGLIGGLNSLNQQLTEEARNLSTALRGSAKAQGDWGEFILRDLLDKAGLREGEQYSFQQNFAATSSAEGDHTKAARTDVIVYLPGGRNLIVDSKVSLTAYTDHVNAAGDEARKIALRQHLASVRGHIAGLTKAGYDRLPGLETPDFVVMFVPVEPAFMLALQNDAELWADAYNQGILLVGPTTLLYIIRIVDVLWRQDRQARNVQDVMERGARLYEKFNGYIADMEEIGTSLHEARRSYDHAWKKLSSGEGNLIRQVEMLRQLGVKPRKPMPPRLIADAETDGAGLALAAEAEEVSDLAS